MTVTNETFRNNKSIATSGFTQSSLILMSVPAGEDVEVYKKNKMAFLCAELPYWVKFTLEPIKKTDVELINNSKEYLNAFFANPSQTFSKKGLQELSGWDIRLVNMFIARKIGGVRFFELNTAGLSLPSIKLMFNFLISELSDSDYNVTYLIIEPDGNFDVNTPIFLDESNLEETFRKIYE